MRRKDTVRLYGNAMLMEFAATGETGCITTLPLDSGVRLTFDGNAILAYFTGQAAELLVERFASEALGSAAYLEVQAAIRRHVRHSRIKNGVKKLSLWIVAPVVTTLLALSLNVAVTRGLGTGGLAPPLTTAAPTGPSPIAQGIAAKASPAEIARAMRDGVKAGKFSIRVSADNKPPLYIFTDPGCSYCHRLEAELQEIGKHYTVHLFPVSVIGGAISRSQVSALLCAATEKRKQAWQKLMAEEPSNEQSCPDGDTAVAANDSIFAAVGFQGTPTIINQNGEQFPAELPNTAAAIIAWLGQKQG